MSTTEKPLLSDYLSREFTARFGSMAQAARELEVPYERFRKALQRNTFHAQDLITMVPDRNIDALRKEFVFKLARRNKKQGRTGGFGANLGKGLYLDEVTDEDVAFISENKVVKMRIISLIHKECALLRDILSDE